MLTPCEVAVKSVIPAIRAYIAKELTQTYKMKQTDVALLLGITQTAVSKYISNVRGQAIRIDHSAEIQSMMNDMSARIAHKETYGTQLILKFCAICESVRQKGLMCELCERTNSLIESGSCRICME
ncbi:MAG TPA: hypothetical protein VJ249_11925 [Candidatus Bathyarchaeia archaeon]|nr:hypothetical protein [Candidatus Bathyarchaeia archaeon]